MPEKLLSGEFFWRLAEPSPDRRGGSAGKKNAAGIEPGGVAGLNLVLPVPGERAIIPVHFIAGDWRSTGNGIVHGGDAFLGAHKLWVNPISHVIIRKRLCVTFGRFNTICPRCGMKIHRSIK
jgi:hypothetical protein